MKEQYTTLPRLLPWLRASSMSLQWQQCDGTAAVQFDDNSVFSVISDVAGTARIANKVFNITAELTLVCDTTNEPIPVVEYRFNGMEGGEWTLVGRGNAVMSKLLIPKKPTIEKIAQHRLTSHWLDLQSLIAAVLLEIW